MAFGEVPARLEIGTDRRRALAGPPVPVTCRAADPGRFWKTGRVLDQGEAAAAMVPLLSLTKLE